MYLATAAAGKGKKDTVVSQNSNTIGVHTIYQILFSDPLCCITVMEKGRDQMLLDMEIGKCESHISIDQ